MDTRPVATACGLVNAFLESLDVLLVLLPGQRPPVFSTSFVVCHKTRTPMNTFTVPSTGRTSAYPWHYPGPWLLAPSRPLATCGWLPARCLTTSESRQRVIPFRVSIFRDRRVVLRFAAGSRLGECHVSAWQHGRRPVPFGPAIQPLGRFCMTTLQPHLHSSLSIATCSTESPRWLAVYRLPFPLLTCAYQAHARGRCCHSTTWRAGVSPAWTLSCQGTMTLPLIPRSSRPVSSERVAHNGLQPTRLRFAPAGG